MKDSGEKSRFFNIKDQNLKWYQLSVDEVFEKLQTNNDGLTDEQVEERRLEFGPNKLLERKPPGIGIIFLHQFLSPLIYILIVAGVVSLLIDEVTDAIFIFGVILLNASLGMFQEWKAETSAAALQKMLKIEALVRRNGIEKIIPSEELVPGDLVLLESGNRVPADIRLFKNNNLTIDESLLTGESVAVHKHHVILPGELALSEQANMGFAGSTVMTGRGLGLVTATALKTEVGKIAKVVVGTALTKPPLIIRMERFAKQISIIVLGFITMLVIYSVSQGSSFAEIFMLAVALAVSSIPEGLPVAMTVALSIATTRMARRHVIVRRLSAVEGLGSCTCIASDKTGTLTVNKQTVKVISLPGSEQLHVSGEGYNGIGEVTLMDGNSLSASLSKRLEQLSEAVAICNEGKLIFKNEEWNNLGDAVDIALLALSYKAGLDPVKLNEKIEVIDEVPFESETRYAMKIYQFDNSKRIAIKGAVESILPFCDTIQTADGIVKINAEAVQMEAERLAEDGYRVIAVAHSHPNESDDPALAVTDKDNIPPLVFLGLTGLIDPLRPEVKGAVEKCKGAGVRVVMITGDHPATALSIAKELNIANDWSDMVTGSQLAEIGNPEVPQFLEVVKNTTVFSRVAPLQKLHITEALIKLGNFVAVTGDGVNDAPALRKANIGVAMGTATDVAKDTASIIVTDDNFASIEGGIEEGRYAYDNIRKVIYLLISTGASEIVLFTLALFSGLPVPLLAAQLLWLNLVTNGIQDVALAFEGGEPGALNRQPRKPTEGVFDSLMTQQSLVSGLTIGLLAYLVWYELMAFGVSELEGRNIILLLMVLFENVHVFNCRSERVSAFRVPLRRNLLLIIGVLVAQGVHIAAMYIPLMQDVLRIQPVSLLEWAEYAGIALILLVVMEVFKIVRRRFAKESYYKGMAS